MDTRKAAVDYLASTRQQGLQDLKDFVSIPSVSTDPQCKDQMLHAAQWLSERLKQAGLQDLEIHETKGHPVITAALMTDPALPTVLIYGHYDVQPVDPLELWNTDPFQPIEQGDTLTGRGSSDMKGQIIASIRAVEAVLKSGMAPVNFKFIIEGEEEIGSPNLAEFLSANKDLLSCDVVLNPDTGMIAVDVPTVVYGLRGLAYFEIRLFGPDHDLHSGMAGGVVRNPANVLCQLIAKMHDEQGRVTLPGFYDRVLPLSGEERKELARLPMDEDYYVRQTGASELWGEEGYSPVERVGGRPTLDVNGLLSGFTGHGSKTVIPARAMAKVSMRLVPNQDPAEVLQQLEKFLEANIPAGIRYELESLSSGGPSISEINTPAARALRGALQDVWGIDPLFKREGGSVPVVGDMQRILGVDSVLTGFGLPEDNIHAPNERVHLPTLQKGTEALALFFYRYGSV